MGTTADTNHFNASSPSAREAARQHAVLAKVRNTRGLVCTHLYAHSDAIQLVTYDGEHLGRIRLADAHARQSWVAVPAGQVMTMGRYHSSKAAAKALAHAAGKPV
ncbi:hypothetical protein ACFHYQ_01130 [Sphaerimonospora cavernae]|uniref:Uncharacterized protein n=1 Tax=Sphaerimonospora cavernae TaxID=1740611 RepID=A0ABV6TXG2_9ACTN